MSVTTVAMFELELFPNYSQLGNVSTDWRAHGRAGWCLWSQN